MHEWGIFALLCHAMSLTYWYIVSNVNNAMVTTGELDTLLIIIHVYSCKC